MLTFFLFRQSFCEEDLFVDEILWILIYALGSELSFVLIGVV